jgi:hypothetical protein
LLSWEADVEIHALRARTRPRTRDPPRAWLEYRTLGHGTHPSQHKYQGLSVKTRLELFLRYSIRDGAALPGDRDSDEALRISPEVLSEIPHLSKGEQVAEPGLAFDTRIVGHGPAGAPGPAGRAASGLDDSGYRYRGHPPAGYEESQPAVRPKWTDAMC